MAVVAAATHLHLGRRVAIKWLRSEYAHSRGRERFFMEARAAAHIESEHVARVIDFGTHEDRPYIVMELLVGRELEALLRDEGPLPIDRAVGYIIQACFAVAEAHELGIVHRDLKPANLFLADRRGSPPLLKVLDFGVSKFNGNSAEDLLELKFTEDRETLGTPLYASPEQLRSPGNVDHRSDIWSLGVTLYQLLTGSYPFDWRTYPALIASVVADAPIPPRKLRPDLPADLEATVLCCLAKDPAQRFPTVRALAEALKPHAPANEAASVDAMPTSVRPALSWPVAAPIADPWDSLRQQRQQPSRRSLWPWLIACLCTGLLCGAALIVLGLPCAGPPAAALEASSSPSAPRQSDRNPSATDVLTPQPTGRPPEEPFHATPVASSTQRQPRAVARPEPPESAPSSSTGTGAPSSEAPPVVPGFLTLDTTPWSTVSVNGHVLGQTPIVGAQLPPGTHTLNLTNAELGIRTSSQVTIREGETTVRRLGIQ